jgi:hypothetical protein
VSFLIPENSSQLSFKLRKFQSIFSFKKFITFLKYTIYPIFFNFLFREFFKLDLWINVCFLFSILDGNHP